MSRRLISEVVDKGTAALVSDLAIDERFAGSDSIIGSGIRSILAAPISDAAGCVGMVAIYSRAHVRRFGEEDMELLVSLASAAALRIRNVALAERGGGAPGAGSRAGARARDPDGDAAARTFAGPAGARDGSRADPGAGGRRRLCTTSCRHGDTLWFIVADAAGKGVSAALFMAVTRTLFRAVAQRPESVGGGRRSG